MKRVNTPIKKIHAMIEKEVDNLMAKQGIDDLAPDDIKKLKDLTAILMNLSKTPDPNQNAGLEAAKALSDEALVKLLRGS